MSREVPFRCFCQSYRHHSAGFGAGSYSECYDLIGQWFDLLFAIGRSMSASLC
jgi:hypothetical protein